MEAVWRWPAPIRPSQRQLGRSIPRSSVMILRRMRAKMLMLVQSAIALLTVALVIARPVNILKCCSTVRRARPREYEWG